MHFVKNVCKISSVLPWPQCVKILKWQESILFLKIFICQQKSNNNTLFVYNQIIHTYNNGAIYKAGLMHRSDQRSIVKSLDEIDCVMKRLKLHHLFKKKMHHTNNRIYMIYNIHCTYKSCVNNIDCLVQDCSNSCALAMATVVLH